MAIPARILTIFVCPETRQPLRLADDAMIRDLNLRIEQGLLRARNGRLVEARLDGGLVRADEALLYPIRRDIPIMLIDEAIPLREGETG